MSQLQGFEISPVEVAKRQKLGLRPGYTVRVWQKVPEKDGKFRRQAFEGLVIACKHGTEPGATFTVRRVASGVGMEKIFPLYSPMIDRVEVLREVKVRRSKLYYIRDKAAREIRRRMRRVITGLKARKDEDDELVEQVIEGIEVEPEVLENTETVENTENTEEVEKTDGETKDEPAEVPTEETKKED
ncbi:MAG TPA: 50S ribosomal protein L19 [Candidatus Paceibacterota bacterium]|mgnify:FL=1|nr:50S ribosomal protein L19 [Candidatus Paceibacterota bacterium]